METVEFSKTLVSSPLDVTAQNNIGVFTALRTSDLMRNIQLLSLFFFLLHQVVRFRRHYAMQVLHSCSVGFMFTSELHAKQDGRV